MNTTNIKNTVINFVVPLVCMVLVVLLSVFVIYPSYKSEKVLREDLTKKTTLRDTLKAKKEALNRLIDFKSVVTEDSVLVDRALVGKELIPELLNQIDAISSESGLKISRLAYSLSKVAVIAEGYSLVDVSLGAVGNANQLIAFLRSVEDASRVIDVDELRFSTDSKDVNALAANIALQSPFMFVDSKPITDEQIMLDISGKDFESFMTKVRSLRYYQVQSTPTQSVQQVLETTPSAPVTPAQ